PIPFLAAPYRKDTNMLITSGRRSCLFDGGCLILFPDMSNADLYQPGQARTFLMTGNLEGQISNSFDIFSKRRFFFGAAFFLAAANGPFPSFNLKYLYL
ncbi:MAG: hypothetical protein K2I84_01570, partial [Bacteroidales bacterium]|nr:hypothetical protein [Bacteroidales bacterium]